MADGSAQSYANHKIVDKALTYIAVLALVSGLLPLASLVGVPYVAALSPILMTVAVVWILFRMRAYATRLQDRIIRLETKLRLQRVLPAHLSSRIDELELTHFIGLRFACDGELPELVEKILANKSMRSDDIKKLVKNWQADHLRV
ncbi:MAG: hypothetical protein IT367_10990 [Candidatus Hydrogenedentes bacterium]|nr:hypothetical protein [Candidatus Hydrogenedentota bacterium]